MANYLTSYFWFYLDYDKAIIDFDIIIDTTLVKIMVPCKLLFVFVNS